METMAGGALLSVAVTQIRIENNPLLDPNCTHVLANYADNRRIRGNRFNCGCELDVPITNITINDVADNCSAIFGALYIFGPNVPSVEILMQKFGNANVVYGEIAVVSTNYEDLKFLKNVEKVEFYYLPQGPNALERFIRIENNVELQRLSWPKLMETTSASLRVAANPKLCVTISELSALLRTWIVRKVEVKVCDEVRPSESIKHVCRIGDTASLDTIPAYCQILVVYESALVVESNVRLKSIFMKDLSRISRCISKSLGLRYDKGKIAA
ncbi:receptor L domain protein [Ancylostoma duodenale]|uniref:Receptor L domain protein n=1 Tax=Ancylostoma duodenale TaxID=51022 RepID=A0A0C2GF46_9BILA|nr:receptor L domain protein [Ancylostoma duodenale]